jgi:hypothetical protein
MTTKDGKCCHVCHQRKTRTRHTQHLASTVVCTRPLRRFHFCPKIFRFCLRNFVRSMHCSDRNVQGGTDHMGHCRQSCQSASRDQRHRAPPLGVPPEAAAPPHLAPCAAHVRLQAGTPHVGAVDRRRARGRHFVPTARRTAWCAL